MLEAGVAGALYLGLVLLMGGGLFLRFVAPELARGTVLIKLRTAMWAGAGIVVLVSVADVVLALYGVLGFLEPDILREYALASFHGQVTAVRIGLLIVLLAWPSGAGRRWHDVVWAGVAVTALWTFSALSHGAAMGGAGPLAVDLVHLMAVMAWVGAVGGAASLPHALMAGATFTRVMERVSTVALGAVTVLVATGVYASTLHVREPLHLTTTSYGWALVAKVAVIVVILGLAARARWSWLPALRRGEGDPRLLRTMRAETALLALVLVLTGVLTTRPLPHGPLAQNANRVVDPSSGSTHGVPVAVLVLPHEHPLRQVEAERRRGLHQRRAGFGVPEQEHRRLQEFQPHVLSVRGVIDRRQERQPLVGDRGFEPLGGRGEVVGTRQGQDAGEVWANVLHANPPPSASPRLPSRGATTSCSGAMARRPVTDVGPQTPQTTRAGKVGTGHGPRARSKACA